MHLKNISVLFFFLLLFASCNEQEEKKVKLSHGVDKSAGGVPVYIITTASAIYYLEKEGGGLSSMLDEDGVDWIGFHNEKGSAHKGEYRGFPNAIHKQDGSYFHAMNAKTDPSSSVVELETGEHVRITFTSDKKQWKGQWDFYPSRCDFTMSKVSPGYHYWVLYEGVPGGKIDSSDFYYASIDRMRHPIFQPFDGDLPAPEWMAFGDQNATRMLYLLHHEDDDLPDNYVCRPDMTVQSFGRQNGESTTKHLNTIQSFSIGFIESLDHQKIERKIEKVVNRYSINQKQSKNSL